MAGLELQPAADALAMIDLQFHVPILRMESSASALVINGLL